MKRICTLSLLFGMYTVLVCGQNIDVQHLALDLQLDWQKKQAFGTAMITASVINKSNKVFLDAGKLDIYAIKCNNTTLAFGMDSEDGDNNLEIFLDHVYKPGEQFTLNIQYHTQHENPSDPRATFGSFGKGLRFLQATAATPNRRKQIWSQGEPACNKYWFPCNEDIADIHTTEIRATLEKPLMLISNGYLVGVTEHPNQTRTFHYTSDKPYPNYLVSIVVGEYEDILQQSGKIPIHNYGYPHEREAVKATVELLPDMLQFMEVKTGYKYPWKHYSQVVVQEYPYPGLTGQHTSAILSDNYIDDYGVHQDYKYLWDGVAVQALANQWFGNLLMPESWEHIWLNNAFAQYFAGLYTIKCNAREEYLMWYYPFEKSNISADWANGNQHAVVPEKVENTEAFTADSYSKYRGALVLRMLQREMGEDKWWKTIKYYVNNNAGKQVNTKTFQQAVEKTAGKSYAWFFDQWLYNIGFPEFEVSHTWNEAQKQLIIKIKQVQESNTGRGSVAPFFQGTIDIEIDHAVKSVPLKAQPENEFRFTLSRMPKFVNFNYEETFLCTTSYQQSDTAYLQQLQHSKDVLARQTALDQLVVTARDSSTSATFKQQIIDAIMAEVKSAQYWRYRWYALGALRKIIDVPYEENMVAFLISTIQQDSSWIKSSAIAMLGKSGDPKYKDIYINALRDKSDRVINAAAIALGNTKSPDAYEILMDLENHPSWKNQNRISALNGLQQLGDRRAVPYALECLKDNRSPRWYLATPVWDYPFAAVNTLVALGTAEPAYPILLERLQASLADNNINDVFQQVQLFNILADKRAVEVYDMLKEKYREDHPVMDAILYYEEQFLQSIQK